MACLNSFSQQSVRLLLLFSVISLIQPPWAAGCERDDNCTVPFPQLHLVDSSLSTNISFSYDLSQSVGFNPRWCINGTNAENPGLWPNLTFTFETNHRETIFTYTNLSPSDTVNGLILYLVNQLESECTNLLKAVSIKSGTGNSTARWILLYIFEGMEDEQCPIVSSSSTVTTRVSSTSTTPQYSPTSTSTIPQYSTTSTSTTPQYSPTSTSTIPQYSTTSTSHNSPTPTTQLQPTTIEDLRTTTEASLSSSSVYESPMISPTASRFMSTRSERMIRITTTMCQANPTAATTMVPITIIDTRRSIQPYETSLGILLPVLIVLLIATNVAWGVIVICLKRSSTQKNEKGSVVPPETGLTFVSVLAEQKELELSDDEDKT